MTFNYFGRNAFFFKMVNIRLNFDGKSYSLLSAMPDCQPLFSAEISDVLSTSPLFLVMELLKSELQTGGDISLEFPQLKISLNEDSVFLTLTLSQLLKFYQSTADTANDVRSVFEIIVNDCKQSLRGQLEEMISKSGLNVKLERLEHYIEDCEEDGPLISIKDDHEPGINSSEDLIENEVSVAQTMVDGNQIVSNSEKEGKIALDQGASLELDRFPIVTVENMTLETEMVDPRAMQSNSDDRYILDGAVDNSAAKADRYINSVIHQSPVWELDAAAKRNKEAVKIQGEYAEEDDLVYYDSSDDETAGVNGGVDNVHGESFKHGFDEDSVNQIDPKRIKV